MADLTQKGGVLYLGGEYCQTIGFNYYTAIDTHWNPNSSDNTHRFAEDFIVLAAKNIKVIKVMITPFWGLAGAGSHATVLGTTVPTVLAPTISMGLTGMTAWSGSKNYYTDPNHGIDALFAAAIANGISIIVGFNWSYKAYPDMFSERYTAWNNPSSQTSIYCKALLTEFVTRYATPGGAGYALNNAIAGWAIWGETEYQVFKDTNGPGVEASVSMDGYARIASEFKYILNTLDTRKRILMGLMTAVPFGKSLSQRVSLANALAGRSEMYRLYDVVDVHFYPGVRGAGPTGLLEGVTPFSKADAIREKYTSTEAIKEYINTLMSFAKSLNIPLVFSEFGVSEGDDAYDSQTFITKAVTWDDPAEAKINTLSCSDMTGLAAGQLVGGAINTFTDDAGTMSQIISVSGTSGAGTFTIGPSFKLSGGATGQTVKIYTSTDNTNTRFQSMINAIKSSGLQLALCWNWNEPKYLTSQSLWSVQTAAYASATGFHYKRYKQLDSIVAANALPTVRPLIRKPKTPTKFASLKYQGPYGLITSATAPVPANLKAALDAGNPNSEFTICLRIRQNNSNDNYTTNNTIQILALKENPNSAFPGFTMQTPNRGYCGNPKAGVAPIATPDSQAPYMDIRSSTGTFASLFNSAGITAPVSAGGWVYLTYMLRKHTGSAYAGAIGTGGITTAGTAVTGVLTPNSTALSGVTTLFTTECPVGSDLYNAAGVFIGRVASVAGVAALTLEASAAVAVTAGQYHIKNNYYTLYEYRDGILIDTSLQLGFGVDWKFGFPALPRLSLFAFSNTLTSITAKTIPFDLADVSLYNRPLSSAEVYSAYVGEPPTDYVAHYKLDAVVGGKFLDSSINGFDLTDNSGAALLVDNSVITRAPRV